MILGYALGSISIFAILAVLVIIDIVIFTVFDKYVWSFITLLGIAFGAFWLLPEFAAFVKAHDWREGVFWLLVYLGIGCVVATGKWIFHNLSVARHLGLAKEKFVKNQKDGDEREALLAKAEAERQASNEWSRLGKNLPETVSPEEWKATKTAEILAANVVVRKEEADIKRRREFIQYFAERYGKVYKGEHRPSSTGVSTEDEMINELTPKAIHHKARITFWALEWPLVLISLVLEDILIRIGEWLAIVFDKVFTGVARRLVGNAIRGV